MFFGLFKVIQLESKTKSRLPISEFSGYHCRFFIEQDTHFNLWDSSRIDRTTQVVGFIGHFKLLDF